MTTLLRFFGFRKTRKIPRPGRKLNKREARDYAFTKYSETMALLAKK